MYYKKQYKKEMLKNAILIGIILFIAIFSTYTIYNSFNNDEKIDYSSSSLDITFHEEKGEELNIEKVVSKPDSLGLASSAHKITVINNLKEPVNYKIKIVDNTKKIEEQSCKGIAIPEDEIRISIKENTGDNQIYNLSDLKDGVLLSTTAKSLEERKYTVRIWVKENTILQNGDKYHYHGLIQIVENNTILAVK